MIVMYCRGFAVQTKSHKIHENFTFHPIQVCLVMDTVVCRTVVMHQAGIGGGLEVFVAGEQ